MRNYICVMSEQSINPSKWLDDYGDYLVNFAFMKLKDRDLAVDFVQDTLVSGIENIDSFRGDASVKTWLTSILNRKIIDHWRKKSTQTTSTFSSYFKENNGHWIDSMAPTGEFAEIENQIHNNELGKSLNECIDHLPNNWKGVVIDKVVLNKDTESVCKEHEISSSNLWVMIHRAKMQLKNCLEKNWF